MIPTELLTLMAEAAPVERGPVLPVVVDPPEPEPEPEVGVDETTLLDDVIRAEDADDEPAAEPGLVAVVVMVAEVAEVAEVAAPVPVAEEAEEAEDEELLLQPPAFWYESIPFWMAAVIPEESWEAIPWSEEGTLEVMASARAPEAVFCC